MIPGLLGSISGGFRPTDISGCVLLLESPAIVGLSDDDLVASWSDLSGLANNALQTNAAKKPTYKTGIVNGHPVVRFAGAQNMVGSMVVGGDAITAFAGFSYAATSQSYARILAAARAASDTEDARSAALLLRLLLTEQLTSYRSPEAKGAVAAAYNIAHVGCSIYDATNNTVWRDGIQGTSVASNETFDINIYSIGDQPDEAGLACLAGDIFFAAVYSRALITIERQSVERYVAQLFGITIDQSPVNTVLPALSAAGWTVGQVASCDTGTWTNSPTTYTYQWYLEVSEATYNQIVGATSSTLLLTAPMAGLKVQCRVSASNAFAGPTEAQSADSDVISA